jgi:hypothetical protein
MIGTFVIALAIGVVFPSEIEAKGKRSQSMVIETYMGPIRLWKGMTLKMDPNQNSVDVLVVNPDPKLNRCAGKYYEFESTCDVEGRKVKVMGFDRTGSPFRVLFKVIDGRQDSGDCDECQRGVLFFMTAEEMEVNMFDAMDQLWIEKKKRKIRRILQQ